MNARLTTGPNKQYECVAGSARTFDVACRHPPAGVGHAILGWLVMIPLEAAIVGFGTLPLFRYLKKKCVVVVLLQPPCAAWEKARGESDLTLACLP